MKKLTIKIGNEKHELPYNGETFSFEVSEKYVPKVGDCVKVECRNPNRTTFYWFKIKETTSAMVDFSLAVGEDLKVSKNGFFNIGDDRIYTKITPEELKAKYAEAGYDWDYERDTVKPLKWMPKNGDKCWVLDSFLQPRIFIYDSRSWFFKQLEKGLIFPTEAECQKFADHCLKYFDKK